MNSGLGSGCLYRITDGLWTNYNCCYIKTQNHIYTFPGFCSFPKSHVLQRPCCSSRTTHLLQGTSYSFTSHLSPSPSPSFTTHKSVPWSFLTPHTQSLPGATSHLHQLTSSMLKQCLYCSLYLSFIAIATNCTPAQDFFPISYGEILCPLMSQINETSLCSIQYKNKSCPGLCVTIYYGDPN